MIQSTKVQRQNARNAAAAVRWTSRTHPNSCCFPCVHPVVCMVTYIALFFCFAWNVFIFTVYIPNLHAKYQASLLPPVGDCTLVVVNKTLPCEIFTCSRWESCASKSNCHLEKRSTKFSPDGKVLVSTLTKLYVGDRSKMEEVLSSEMWEEKDCRFLTNTTCARYNVRATLPVSDAAKIANMHLSDPPQWTEAARLTYDWTDLVSKASVDVDTNTGAVSVPLGTFRLAPKPSPKFSRKRGNCSMSPFIETPIPKCDEQEGCSWIDGRGCFEEGKTKEAPKIESGEHVVHGSWTDSHGKLMIQQTFMGVGRDIEIVTNVPGWTYPHCKYILPKAGGFHLLLDPPPDIKEWRLAAEAEGQGSYWTISLVLLISFFMYGLLIHIVFFSLRAENNEARLVICPVWLCPEEKYVEHSPSPAELEEQRVMEEQEEQRLGQQRDGAVHGVSVAMVNFHEVESSVLPCPPPAFRGAKLRGDLEKEYASIQVQAWWRGYMERIRFDKMIEALEIDKMIEALESQLEQVNIGRVGSGRGKNVSC